MTYTCYRNGRTYKRVRIHEGAKAWRGVPSFLRTEECWGCGLPDCPKSHMEVTA